MIIFHKIFLCAGVAKRVMMQDSHHHEDQVGNLYVEGVGMGDTSGAFTLGKY